MIEHHGFVDQQNTGIQGVVRCYKNPAEHLVVAEVTEEIYRTLGEDVFEQWIGDVSVYTQFQTMYGCHFLLLVWKEQEEDCLFFCSDTRRVRAIEFMDYMISEFGLVKGSATAAAGRISSAILKVQMSGMDMEDTMEYYLERSASYYTESQIVEAAEFGIKEQAYIRSLPQYEKKKIPWAYVRSTDIVPEGQVFLIRSLENESGIDLMAHTDVYIMIGCRGEAYDITRQKFERTYEPSEERLDIFEQMLDFIPEVELLADGSFVSLDELAHLCYPKQGNTIYAVSLQERTKVFPCDGEEEYYLGRPGDYLAVRSEDLTDIYIIQQDIFRQTYEKIEDIIAD
ncbi:MAG: hypothetical protein J6A03_10665 [Lachnospiraceae bacterium]|nr:hypothetical protein [Lachnospiraceae bacterium]